MSQSPNSDTACAQELLERGRLTLQSLQYKEQAARFKAEASSLQAAMVKAEHGDTSTLASWLNIKSKYLEDDIVVLSDLVPPDSMGSDSATFTTAVTRLERHGDKESVVEKVVLNDLSQVDVETNSPWAAMEQGALQRLQSEDSMLPIELVNPIDRVSTWGSPESEPTESEPTESALNSAELPPHDLNLEAPMDSEIHASTETIQSDGAEGPTLDEWLNAMGVADDAGTQTRRRPWWAATDIWVSVATHFVLVIVLSVIVISAAQKPVLLSIVASPVDADNVLMETPMEMISDLQASEPSMSENNLSVADLVSDVRLPEVAMAEGVVPAVATSLSNSLSGAASEANAAMTGSKMVAGAEFFGAKATGNTFVYIVDSSPSMRRDGAFDAAKQEMMRSLASMKPKQRYFISFFGKEVDPLELRAGHVEEYPVEAKPENLSRTLDWLASVQIQKDGWPPNDALSQAIQMQPDAIFLLFDGDTRSDVAKYLRKVNRSSDILTVGMPKVPIHVIHFFQDEFQKQMKQVADENGGTYRFIPRPDGRPKGKR